MNLAQLMIRAGSSYAELPAVFQGTKHLCSYRTLSERVASLAGGLRSRGLEVGDRVALISKNCPEYVELMFACWHAGLVLVPVNAKLHIKEFQYVLQHSGARACFVSPSLVGEVECVRRELPELAWIEAISSSSYHNLAEASPMAMVQVEADKLAWLFYTSGTTGRPKGAMLSHRNLLAMSLSYFSDVDPITPGDCIIHAAPMSHGSGLYVLPHVAAAAAHVVPDSAGFEPEEIFALIRAHRRAGFFAAPTMVSRLTNSVGATTADLRNLRTIVYGGGPMYLEDCKKAIEVFGHDHLAQIYGQGESPMTITALGKHHFANRGHERFESRLASVGVPQTGTNVIVADDRGHALAAGETGEIIVRGDAVMQGYWRNPGATSESLVGGWLRTGDMGVFDDDGFLTLKDRSKDVIISGGTNIYPREVEEVLLRDPRLLEVAVIGRPHSDWGEELVAFVVCRPGNSVGCDELDALCLEHIARFKRPKEYQFVEALPKNSYGKVVKTELRSALKDGMVSS